MRKKKITPKLISGIISAVLIGSVFTITALADARPDINVIIRRGERRTHTYTEYLASGDGTYDINDVADPTKYTVGTKMYWESLPEHGTDNDADGYAHNLAADGNVNSPEIEFYDSDPLHQDVQIYVEDFNKMIEIANYVFADYFSTHIQERADNILIRATDDELDETAEKILDGTIATN